MSDSEIAELTAGTERHNPDAVMSRTINKALADVSKRSNRPFSYSKNSRTTRWRQEKAAKAVNNKGKLTSFGFVPVERVVLMNNGSPVLTRSERKLMGIDEILPKLQEFVKPVVNSKHEGSKADTYNCVRYSSINCYFMKRIAGVKTTLASREAARIYWPKNNVAYRAMTILAWSKEFSSEGKLSNNKQGVHAKRKSFLNDSDIKQIVLEEIRKTKPVERSLVAIKKFIDEVIAPSVLGVTGKSVFETTISKYLHEWG